MAGGIVEVDIDRAKPGKTLVPGRHLHPDQPASVVAPVSESQPQVFPDVKSIAASKLAPPHEGVHLAKLPVVVLVVKNIRSTAARPGVHAGAQLHRKFAPGAEEAEEAAKLAVPGDRRDEEEEGSGKFEVIISLGSVDDSPASSRFESMAAGLASMAVGAAGAALMI